MDMHSHLIGDDDNGQGYAQLVMRSGAQEAVVGVRNARATLMAGFTTVRDIGTFRAFVDVALRDGIDAGWFPGPRMMCAGAYVTTPGGAGDVTGLAVDVDEVVPRELRFGVTSGVDQMRSTVRQVLRYGADFIKVLATGAVLTSGTKPGMPEFTEDELRAAVEEAEGAGAHVAAHAHGAEGIKRAVRAGVRSIEHGSLMDDEAIELMAERGTYLVADMYDGDYMLEVGPSLGYTDEVIEKVAPHERRAARGVHEGREGGGAHRVRHRLGHRAARAERAAVPLLRAVRAHADAGDPERDAMVGRADAVGGPRGNDRRGPLRRPDRRAARPDRRRLVLQDVPVRDEGRRGRQGG